MSNKKEKKILDFTCEYCGKRYNLEELKEDGYDVKCETQQLIK